MDKMKRRFTALILLVVWFLLPGCDRGTGKSSAGREEEVFPEAVSLRLVPSRVTTTVAEKAAALCDGNTTSSMLPDEGSEIRIAFSEEKTLTSVNVYGSNSFTMNIFQERSGVVSQEAVCTVEGSSLKEESWNRVRLSPAVKADALIIRCSAGESTATLRGIRELEFWGEERAVAGNGRLATTLSGIAVQAELEEIMAKQPPHVRQYRAVPELLSFSQNSESLNGAELTIELPVLPSMVRRAYLSYSLKGASERIAVERKLNTSKWQGGFTHAGEDTGWHTYIEELDPCSLLQGSNTLELKSTAEKIELKDCRLTIELAGGWNYLAGYSVEGMDDGNVATGYELTGGNAPLEVSFQHTLLVREILLHVGEGAVGTLRFSYLKDELWHDLPSCSIACADLDAGWNRIVLPAEVIGKRMKCFMEHEGDRLVLNEFRLSGSPVGLPWSDEIVITYPRKGEYFGDKAYLEGFVRTSYALSDSARVEVPEEDDAATSLASDRSFSFTIHRLISGKDSGSSNEEWVSTVKARDHLLEVTKGVSFYADQEKEHADGGGSTLPGENEESTSDAEESTADQPGITTLVRPECATSISYGSVNITIPAGAVEEATEIRIIPLSQEELQKLNVGMVNVTYPAAGYRFLPHGVFRKDLNIEISYNSEELLPGQKDDDVHMYYFNEEEQLWKQLERVTVDKPKKLVVSRTNHFTDIINATLVMPENPDALSYNPNSIKDIKAASPLNNVSLIEPPRAVSSGDTSLSYSLEVPPGRKGMQPSLAVRYSSTGANGWLGLGWDIHVPSINIDTRFGVPRYNGSERYLLDGSRLVHTSGNQFRERVEGKFNRIIRKGSDSSSYWWEVTGKQGTRYIYGRSGNSRVARGNIFQWNLEEAIDRFGNTMRYTYWHDNDTNGEPSTRSYLASIQYTGSEGGSAGPFTVRFVRESEERSDQETSCRSGFKIKTRYRLSRVDVLYNDEVVRSYGFTYKDGLFGKSLLEKITHYGLGGEEKFYEHSFKYYDDLNSNNGRILDGFAGEQEWNKQFDGYLGLGQNIGGNGGGSVYVGFSPFNTSKSISMGVQVGVSMGGDTTYYTVMDIDGDNLPDQVYAQGVKIYYRKNLGGPNGINSFAEQGVEIGGISATLGAAMSMSICFGAQAHLAGFSATADVSLGMTLGLSHFTDVNGDGLVDFVNGANVVFNRLENGVPTFSDTSSIPLGGGVVSTENLDLGQNSRPSKAELAKDFYRDDPIRMWRAPFRGIIELTGAVKLLAKDPGSITAQNYETDDGVEVAIYRSIAGGEKLLWEAHLEPGSDEATPAGLADLWVEEGDEIYFKVNSVDDGSYDVVSWDPVIRYLGEETEAVDENNLPVYVYQSSKDFSLAGREMGFTAGEEGNVMISGVFNKSQITSDNVVLRILKRDTQGYDTVIHEEEIDGTFTGSRDIEVAFPTATGSYSIVSGEHIVCELRADTPIDWQAVSWSPVVSYSDVSKDYATDEEKEKALASMIYRVPVSKQLFPVRDNEAVQPYTVRKSGRARVRYQVSVFGETASDPFDGLFDDLFSQGSTSTASAGSVDLPADYRAKIVLAVKREGQCEAKSVGYLEEDCSGEIVLDATLDVAEGDQLYFICSSDRYDLLQYVTLGLPEIYYEEENSIDDVTGEIALEQKDEGSGMLYRAQPADYVESYSGGYRQWYFARWNGENDFDLSLAKLPEELDAASMQQINEDNYNDADNQQALADMNNQLKTFMFMLPQANYYYDEDEGKYKQQQEASLTVESSYNEATGEWSYSETAADNSSVTLKEMWVGNDPDCWISGSMMSATRVMKKYLPEDGESLFHMSREVATSTNQSGPSGRGRGGIMLTMTDHYAVGASAKFIGYGNTRGYSHTKTGFFDLNGDRYPDQIGVTLDKGLVQYTYPDGSLGATTAVSGWPRSNMIPEFPATKEFMNVRKSHNDNYNYNVDTPSIMLTKSDAKGKAKGIAAHAPALGFSGTAGRGTSITDQDFIDMNGDGLPDIVMTSGSNMVVRLNLGYRFGEAEVWETDAHVLRKNVTASIGGGAGFSWDKGAYGGGAAVSVSQSGVEYDYVDMNGDGLPDRVYKPINVRGPVKSTDSIIRVWFNTGNGFQPTSVSWKGADTELPLTLDASFSVKGSGYGTAAPQIWIGPVFIGSIIINPGAYAGVEIGKVEARLQDINGDGYVDHVSSGAMYSDSVMKMKYNLNNTGRTNLLKEVIRPLGGSFTIEYARKGNTQDMPSSRWVLSQVTAHDGMSGLDPDPENVHSYTTRFDYGNGYYDRVEREFYGFDRVSMIRSDGTRTDTHYYNHDYYLKHLAYRTEVRDNSNNIYSLSQKTYGKKELTAGLSYFPYVEQEDNFLYEGTGTGTDNYAQHTRKEYSYTNYGDVERMIDRGNDGDDQDDRIVTLAYTHIPDIYVMGLPSLLEVYGGDGKCYRKRTGMYDGKGNLRELHQVLGKNYEAVSSIEYDRYGNVIRTTGPANAEGQRFSKEYTYDSTLHTYMVAIEDSFGNSSKATYDYRFGVMLASTDINNNHMKYAYDTFGRMKRLCSPYDLSSSVPTIAVSYNLADLPARALTRNKIHWDHNQVLTTVTFVDGAGRVVQTKKSAEVEHAYGMTVSGKAVYDAMGRILKTGQPAFVAGEDNSFVAQTEARNPTSYTYDAMDRKLTTTYPGDRVATNEYFFENGKSIVRITDAEGKTQETVKDVRGLTLAVRQYYKGKTLTTEYGYNPMGEIVTVKDVKGALTTAEYDNLGRRISLDNPDTGLYESRYDLAGNLVKKITPNLRENGTFIAYTYTYGRLDRINYPQMPDVYYTYGKAGAADNSTGRLVSVDNGVVRETYKYGRLGEVIEEQRIIGVTVPETAEKRYTTKYAYDLLGRLQSLTYPDGEILSYGYDRGGRLVSATGLKDGKERVYMKDIAYDEFGQRTELTYGNGVVTRYVYQPDTRYLKKISTKNGDKTYQNLEYYFDRVGNILKKTNTDFMTSNEVQRSVIQRFSYDDLHRLTGSEGRYENQGWLDTMLGRNNTYSSSLQYDTNGNILKKEQVHEFYDPESGTTQTIAASNYTLEYTYNASRPHAVTYAGDAATGTGKTYGYDANGNMLSWKSSNSQESRTLCWNEENRLTSTTDSLLHTSYYYDAGGTRVIKRGAQGEVVYVNTNYALRNNAVESKHVFIDGSRIATSMRVLGEANTDQENQRTYYYHADHLGSSSMITDQTGNCYEHLEYFPYGETWVDERGSSEGLPYKFTGKEKDQETGLYYYGARYYDPQLSRWISVDPFLVTGAYLPTGNKDHDAKLPGMGGVFNNINLNAYHYAGDNPVKYTDPDGNTIYLYSGKEILFFNPNAEGIDVNKVYAYQTTALRRSIIGLIFGMDEYKLLGSVEFTHHGNTVDERFCNFEKNHWFSIYDKNGDYVAGFWDTVSKDGELELYVKGAHLLIDFSSDAFSVLNIAKAAKGARALQAASELMPTPTALKSYERGKSVNDILLDILPIIGTVRSGQSFLQQESTDLKNKNLLEGIKSEQ